MKRIIYSSDGLPAELNERQRMTRCLEMIEESLFSLEMSFAEDRRFSANYTFTQIGDMPLVAFSGTMNRAARTRRTIVDNPSDSFGFGFNTGKSPCEIRQRRTLTVDPAGLSLVAHDEVCEMRCDGSVDWTSIKVPRQQLIERIPRVEEMIAAPLDPNIPAAGLLRDYIQFLLNASDIPEKAAITQRIDTVLLDLISLALGASRDVTELASQRGLRMSRLRKILGIIRENFANPAFSCEMASRAAGVSVRHLQDILQETGRTFVERVLELRLQEARRRLMSSHHGRTRVSDIATACGFADQSHFNRSFRRRFGTSPTQYRSCRSETEKCA
jgi:AraC-like DNA-binding protein